MNRVATQVRRAGGVIAMLSLAALHAAFLSQRLADDSIREPRVVARWLAAALLLACLFLVRRYAVRPLRFLLAFWLLAAILHAAIPADDHLLDIRDRQLVVLVLASGLLVAVAFFPSRDRSPRFISRIAPREAFSRRSLAVCAIATRAPPAR